MKNISSNFDSLNVSKNFNINNYNPSSRSNSTMSYENVNVDCTNSSDSNTESIDVMAPLHLADSVKENYYPNASNNLSNEEIMEQWITYIKTTIEQLEAEKKKFIEDHYFKFNKEHFDDLLIDQVTGEYLTPEQYKYSEDALETFLYNNGYPINDHVDPNKYLEGVDAFHEVEVKRYSELYSKYFKEITGITYEEYVDQINTYNSDINSLKSSKYSLEQQLKESPYLDLIETDAYKKFYQDNPNLYQEIIEIYDSGKYKIFNDSLYVDASCITEDYIYNGSDNVVTIDGKIYYKYQSPDDYKKDSQALETYLINHGYSIDPFYDPIAYNKGVEEFNNYIDVTFNSDFNYEFLYSMINTKDGAYLNEDEKKVYIYLLCNEGNDAAADYLVAIEDRINQRKGKEEADRFLASITDENGEINYNVWTMLLANGQGILSGIENFGEGLANIFTTEGMISDNQYAQMYILEALTNTSGAYVNSLAQVILEEKGEDEATEFINNMIDTTTGEINLEYAKEVLTEEEYTKLEYKINKDKNTILDNSFELGTSFGNMLPSMALTMTLSYCGAAPAATSLIGNVLMGMSAGGNAKNQALVSGNDLLSSTIYGILSGTSETCLGLLLGNIPGLNENASLSFKGIFKEGMEEFLQEYVDAGLRCTILGEEINLDELNQDAIKSFVFGVLISFGTNTASMGVKFIINKKSVELNSMADVKAFFQILNDSGILIENRTEDGVGKTILIDESITNKSEMVDIMKSIYKDAEIFIKTADGNVSYAGYSGYDAGSDSSITTGDSMGHVGFQFFGGEESFFKPAGDLTDLSIISNDTNTNYDYSLNVNDIINSFMFEESISDVQLQQFTNQVNNFLEISRMPKEIHNPKLDENGKVILKNGTLIHGTRFNEAKLESISNVGILSGQAFGIPEDGETFCCADFYKINGDLSLESVNKSLQESIVNLTPFGTKNNSRKSVAFIVNSNMETQKLFNYDCYATGTIESDITRTFVNQYGLLNFEGDVGLSSILYGVPSNCIEGIIVGDDIASSSDKIDIIKKQFPNCYITDRNGNLIYNPTNNININGINSSNTVSIKTIDDAIKKFDYSEESAREYLEIRSEISNLTIPELKNKINSYDLISLSDAQLRGLSDGLSSFLMPILSKFYNSATNFAINKGTDFDTYCDHTIGHVEEVAYKTLETKRVLEMIIENDPSAAEHYAKTGNFEIIIAGLCHDTGMSNDGAISLSLTKDSNGYLAITFSEVSPNDSGNNTRTNHALNSALNALKISSELRNFGVDPNKVALLCIAHSKSCSGISNLVKYSGWSAAIDKINAAVEGYNSKNSEKIIFTDGSNNFIESLVRSGILLSDNIIAEGITREKVEVGIDGDGKPIKEEMEIKVGIHDINPNIFKELSSGSADLRLGDANAQKGKINDGVMSQRAGIVLYDKSSIVSEESLTYDFSKGWKHKAIAAAAKAETATMNVSIIPYGKSKAELYKDGTGDIGKAFVIGEDNIFMNVNVAKTINGLTLVERFTVGNALQGPLSTIFAIEERLGELDTISNLNRKVEVVFDISTPNIVLDFYQSWANVFNKNAGKEYMIEIIRK